MALYEPVSTIVSDVAVQCGLGAVSDAFASTDSGVVQMRNLLTSVGRRLLLRYPFLQSKLEHTFVTDGSTEYDLPDDFSSMIDQTGWNRTTREPALAASRQTWQYLQAAGTSSTILTVFKPKHLTLELLTASSGETIAFEYLSRYWVAETGNTTPTDDAPDENDDVVIIHAELIKAALRYQFLKDKGFASQSAADDFLQTLADVKGHQVWTAPTIYLGGRGGPKYLDMSNAPAQGYGMALGDGGLF